MNTSQTSILKNRSWFWLMLFAATFVLSPRNALGQAKLKWLGVNEAQTLAESNNKTLFIFVEAEWCAVCKQMRKEVFPDSEVVSLLSSQYVSSSIDLDSQEAMTFNQKEYSERSFARWVGVEATPTMIFADPDGNILGTASGFYDEQRLRLLLTYIRSDLFETLTFSDFEKKNALDISKDG